MHTQDQSAPSYTLLQGTVDIISVATIIISAALRHQCKMVIGAELSIHAGVRRSNGKRFHES
jgi:predicted thioesterase